jgi:hypothetical protein
MGKVNEIELSQVQKSNPLPSAPPPDPTSRIPTAIPIRGHRILPERECCCGFCDCCLPTGSVILFPDENPTIPREHRWSPPRIRPDGTIHVSSITSWIYPNKQGDYFWVWTRGRFFGLFGGWILLSIILCILGVLTLTLFMGIDKEGYRSRFEDGIGTLNSIQCYNDYTKDSVIIHPNPNPNPNPNQNVSSQSHQRNLRYFPSNNGGDGNFYRIVLYISYQAPSLDSRIYRSENEEMPTTKYKEVNECKNNGNSMYQTFRQEYPEPNPILIHGLYDRICTYETLELPNQCFFQTIPEYDQAGFIALGVILIITSLVSVSLCICSYCIVYDNAMKTSYKDKECVYIPRYRIRYD